MDFTLGSMYWINPKYSLEDFREDMRRVRENRLTLLRIFIQWEYVEAEKNRFDFSVYDRFFQAAEESGIGVMPTLLFYLPLHRLIEQQENGRSDAGRRYPCLDRPEIRDWVEKFFSETVLHYKVISIPSGSSTAGIRISCRLPSKGTVRSSTAIAGSLTASIV